MEYSCRDMGGYKKYVWKFIKDIGDMYGNIKKHQEYVWTSKEI